VLFRVPTEKALMEEIKTNTIRDVEKTPPTLGERGGLETIYLMLMR